MSASEWIPRFSVDRPVTVVTTFLVVCVLGWIALWRIPLQMMPSGYSPPFLWVWVPYADSTPIETEQSVLLPLEEQIATVPGLRTLESNADAEDASLSLQFQSSVDMDEAYNATVDRIERAMPSLPSDVERAWVFRFDPTDEPIVWAGIAVPEGAEDVHWLVSRVIQKRLERVPGVGRVDVWGVDEPVVWVDFDREALVGHGVDLLDVVTRLGTDNFQLASGELSFQGRVRYLRALARYESLEELRQWPVRPGLRLGDIAEISHRPASSSDINRIDGGDGAAIAINKESSANTVDVCRQVREAFAELEADPRLAGFRFPVFFDQGTLIQESVDNLQEAALEGGVLAVLVLMLFLREWRITAQIAATIPASLLLTVTVMYFRGDSMNLLSMLGLMIAVGMVVDNAVVVVETIHRHRQSGEDPRTAAIRGTAEVLLPITLSTLTSAVVFLPVILMSEDASFSFFMGALGLPVVFIQFGSLAITLLFTPLSTVWLGGSTHTAEPRWMRWLVTKVDAGVSATLRYPADTAAAVLAMVLLTLVLPAQQVGCSDTAEGNLNDFTVRYTVPTAYTYYERLDVVKAFEAMVQEHRDEWGVRTFRSRLGARSRGGRIFVYLRDDSPVARAEVLERVAAALPDLPGVEARVGWGESGGEDTSIRLNLRGEDSETLALLSTEARRRIRALPGVLGVDTDVEDAGSDEIRLAVDRAAAARYGVAASSVGRVVSFAMRGTPLPAWHAGEKEVRVFARFSEEDRVSVDALLDTSIGSASGSVPLRALVNPAVGAAWGAIHRTNRATSLGLTVELAPGVDKTAMYAAAESAVEGMDWPRGYGLERGQGWDAQVESDEARNLALLLSIVFVFLIMGVLFESWLLPMAVITTVPMAMLGVYWGLWISGTPFDAMAGVGMIILIGIVVNNGIVLLDLVTELRATRVIERDDALREAVRTRLRPILMTALTAIVGVLPMALGNATFIGIPYAPLGRVILSGMVVATVLTVFVVPYLYAVLDDTRETAARWAAWVLARPAQGRPSP